MFVKLHNYPGLKPPAYKMIPQVFVSGSISMIAFGHFDKITFSSKRRKGRGDPNEYSFAKTFFCALNTKLRSTFSSLFSVFLELWMHGLPGLRVGKNYIPGIFITSAQKKIQPIFLTIHNLTWFYVMKLNSDSFVKSLTQMIMFIYGIDWNNLKSPYKLHWQLVCLHSIINFISISTMFITWSH